MRGAYLKAALGGKIVKNVSTVKRPVLNDDGEQEYEVVKDPKTGKEKTIPKTAIAQVQETEFEQPPNIQALSTWLYHHDPEWRRIQRGEPDPEDVGNAEQGLNIEAWIAKENEIVNNMIDS